MHVQFLHRDENAAVQVKWHPTDPIFVMREFDSSPSFPSPLRFPSSPNDALDDHHEAQAKRKVSTIKVLVAVTCGNVMGATKEIATRKKATAEQKTAAADGSGQRRAAEAEADNSSSRHSSSKKIRIKDKRNLSM